MTANDTQNQVVKSGQHIKLPVLAPLFAAISVLLVTFTIATYQLQQKNIDNDLRSRIENTNELFHEELAGDARFLSAMIHLLKNDSKLQQLWLTKDRDALNDYVAPVFEKLRDDYRITHFYFIDVNQACFLRAHNPAGFGDVITRTTLVKAARNGKPFWGIELGKYGTFTLRNVHPWFINNSLAGYIELGEEIEHITSRLKETYNVDLVVFINKSLLERRSWEQGQKIMGRMGDWERLPDSVIADSTMPLIPPDFTKFVDQAHHEHKDRIFSSKFNGSTYRAGFIRLFDAGRGEVGDILIIKNVSKDYASLHSLLAIVAVLCLAVAVILVLFFYIHINGIQNRLTETHSALVTEITKREIVESELRRNRDNLEYIVNVRTAELEKTNKQLKQEVAQRTKAEQSLEKLNADLEATVSQLIRSNRQLHEFAHLTAHDLKTPLRGIGTLTQWLLKDYHDKFDDEGRKQLDLLVKRIWRVDKIMNVILQYSTIARNKYNEHRVDLNELLKEVISQVKAPQNIKIAINKGLPALICDEKLIYQVFCNLIDNAVKFMDKPEGHIKIDCEDEGIFWKFSVCDNGPGIERRHFERIFQLFQTLSDDGETPNVGAGLTITRKIVELYDGKVWLTSAANQGSTFFFTWAKTPAAVIPKTPLFATT